jgi:hypothetical protein
MLLQITDRTTSAAWRTSSHEIETIGIKPHKYLYFSSASIFICPWDRPGKELHLADRWLGRIHGSILCAAI